MAVTPCVLRVPAGFSLLPGVAERGCIPLLVLPLGLINLKLVEHRIPRGLVFCLPSSPVSLASYSHFICDMGDSRTLLCPSWMRILLAKLTWKSLVLSCLAHCKAAVLNSSTSFKCGVKDFILDLPAIFWNVIFQSIKRGTVWLFGFFSFVLLLPSLLPVCGRKLATTCMPLTYLLLQMVSRHYLMIWS